MRARRDANRPNNLVNVENYADNRRGADVHATSGKSEMIAKKPKKSSLLNGSHGSRRTLRLHGSIARDIGVLIVSGRYRPGHVLDGEVEASERRKVSRTAYREAVRILS